MRTTLVTGFILLLINSLFPQTIPEPIQLNRSVLVNSAGLPEEYMLFVPDTATQIFFNPARAGSFSGSFVYVNYFSDYTQAGYAYLNSSIDYAGIPDAISSGVTSLSKSTGTPFNFPIINEETYTSSRNPSFSVASLIDNGDVKWLFSLSNGIYTNKSERSTIISSEQLTSTASQIVNERINQDNISDASATVLKISRITSSGENNYSLGIWGILYNYNYSTTYFTLHDEKRIYPASGGGYGSYNTSVINQNVTRDNSRFSAGLEFAFNNKSFDYIGRLGYQLNKSPQEAFSEKVYTQIDSSFNPDTPGFNNTYNYSLMNGILEGNINGIDLYNYISHSAGLITPNDKMFISLYAFHTGGDKSYSGRILEERTYQSSNGNNSQDTILAEQLNSLNCRNNGIMLSAGYALRLTLGDIKVLSGLKILGIYRDTKDVDASITTSSNYFYEFTYIKKSAELTFPVYLNYSPEKWISLYGGMNFTYAYTNEKYDITDRQFVYNGLFNNSDISRKRINNDSYWRSKKIIYAGFELRHSSGLRIQTYFDESFTNIRDWNVSVGYHF